MYALQQLDTAAFARTVAQCCLQLSAVPTSRAICLDDNRRSVSYIKQGWILQICLGLAESLTSHALKWSDSRVRICGYMECSAQHAHFPFGKKKTMK